MEHYFPYDVKLRLLVDSRSFLANQKARNAIVGAENLLKAIIPCSKSMVSVPVTFLGVFIVISVYFSIFWGRFLIKQLFHSRLLDMR